ncbi:MULTISPECIES: hypothetical protein [unclassified Microcoleus]|uniref:hypothetical protein n=1 Tax=unclassified Microcoleus TaxID=2642155 RepID=UPI001E0E2660|nr:MULTISPECIES: hypothetical protein [unclassified Microcoleus]MCC3505272.1 hypothetical protein [Microcoleus sp. PH2017_19_SFW_U_A]TAF89877.1 MAG: hypothetical protein EAZ49_11085 [Oscillatoriales cyanobacterium]MCC3446054.1 hypothetical protein [Microcoleus sp. PH2017_09_SFU_O_A]MCC3523238.1 hypothetical protein [Microcoleus sp. PH2017_20_SFW_D_A]MCC3554516.1 hypothetical protein [Microcoleus sp. PH2017_35_SFW_U_B]
MEGFTLGAVVTGIATNILAHYPDWVVCKGVKSFVNYLKQDDKLINHHLQKALKSSLLSALQNIARECENQLVGLDPKNMLMVMVEHPPEPSYPPEREQDIKILNDKLIRLGKELGKIKKLKDIEPLIDSIEEISLLLTPEGELAKERIKKIKDDLIAEALLRYGDLPECYRAKVREVLFQRVCEQFSAQIKYVPEVRRIFQAQLLAQVHANSAEQQQKTQKTVDDSMSILLSEMGNLKNTVQQVLNRSDEHPPIQKMELEKCAEGTLVLKLSIDNISAQRLTEIVQYLQRV